MYDGDSFSSDWTRFRRGERGGSAFLGQAIWRTMVGGECILDGKDCVALEIVTGCPLRRGDGER